jgi:hypothetical protein
MKGKILSWQRGVSTSGEEFTQVDIELAGRPYSQEQMMGMIGTDAEVFAGDWIYRHQPLAWTAEPPTVPGSYRCAYRFGLGPWIERQMRIHAEDIPIAPDTSETLWFGPIPELPEKVDAS